MAFFKDTVIDAQTGIVATYVVIQNLTVKFINNPKSGEGIRGWRAVKCDMQVYISKAAFLAGKKPVSGYDFTLSIPLSEIVSGGMIEYGNASFIKVLHYPIHAHADMAGCSIDFDSIDAPPAPST